MYIHDISRDTLTTETYPGDPETVVTPLRSIDEDDECNLSQILCAFMQARILTLLSTLP
mgnify:CR=1 FL=1